MICNYLPPPPPNTRINLFISIQHLISPRDAARKIAAKFVHAFLPDAKKPYNLRAVFQPELDIHGIAGKAEVYNIETSPKVIEEGFTAACELIYYLTADGYGLFPAGFHHEFGEKLEAYPESCPGNEAGVQADRPGLGRYAAQAWEPAGSRLYNG
jgi:hypothetical protein